MERNENRRLPTSVRSVLRNFTILLFYVLFFCVNYVVMRVFVWLIAAGGPFDVRELLAICFIVCVDIFHWPERILFALPLLRSI